MFPIGLKTCKILLLHSVISVVLKVDCKLLFVLSRVGGRGKTKQATSQVKDMGD